MFTGIIEKLGRVRELEPAASANPAAGRRLLVETGFTDLELGESVAVNGVCLTVAEAAQLPGQGGLTTLFFVSPETLERSALGSLAAGSRVNLERALLATSRLSGHLVQGHVDGLARVIESREVGECHALELELAPGLSRYCVRKGSIALDGVSLTINEIHGDRLRVLLIPHSWSHTRFPDLAAGDPVNVEVDVLAKYMEKLCQPYLPPSKI
jgi:riboflavin synthase